MRAPRRTSEPNPDEGTNANERAKQTERTTNLERPVQKSDEWWDAFEAALFEQLAPAIRLAIEIADAKTDPHYAAKPLPSRALENASEPKEIESTKRSERAR